MDLKPGLLLVEKFEIIEKIGSGGMGAVYTAKHLALNKTIVLKFLLPSADMSKALIRFQNEAKILGKLKHPGIADIYDVGMVNGGGAYLALEYIDGITMEEFIASKETLPISQLLQIFVEIADALKHAHNAGVIHRDIKPGNIMLVKTEDLDFSPVLLDFGIAKYDTADGATQSLTGAGVAIGSPLYMSPEQCLNQDITAASDQYSLGCVLYECLTGDPPFVAENSLATMQMHLLCETPDLTERVYTEAPEELRNVVNKMLQKEPANRFSSMKKLIDELQIVHLAAEELERGANRSAFNNTEQAVHTDLRKFLSPKWLAIYAGLGALIGIAFMASVSRDTSLKTVTYRDTDFGGGDSERSHDADIREKGVLDASRSPTETDESLARYKGIKKLRSLDLSHNEVSDRALEYFYGSKVSTLGLKETKVKTLEHLPQYKDLTVLGLAETQIEDAAVKNIAELKKLRVLDLSECSYLTAKCLPDIQKIKTLAVINLEQTNIAPEEILKLQGKMPALRTHLGEPLVAPIEREANDAKANSDFARGAHLYQKCVDTIFSAQGDDAPAAVPYLVGKSHCLSALGQKKESREYAEKALSIARLSGEESLLSRALTGMAHYYAQSEGDLNSAIKCRREQVNLNKEADPDGPEYADNLFSLAQLLLINGEYAESKKVYKEALRRGQKLLKSDHCRKNPEAAKVVEFRTSRNKHGLGVAYLHSGELEQARKWLTDAHDEYPAPKGFHDAEVYGDVCMQLSTCMQRLQRPQESLQYAREAYETAKKFKTTRWKDFGNAYAGFLELNGAVEEAARIKLEISGN